MISSTEQNDSPVVIDWGVPDRFKRFKAEYEKQRAAGNAEFTFDGHQFVTGYAKYLIEYLKTLLPPHLR